MDNGRLAIQQISSCPLLLLISTHPLCSFLSSTFLINKESSRNTSGKNKRKCCSVFPLKQDTAAENPFHVLVFVFLCMPHRWLIGFEIVLLECHCGFCGTNRPALCVFFNAPPRQEEMDVLFPQTQRAVLSGNLFHHDMLRRCLMSSFKCQLVHKRSQVIICFKDFKSWP